jgi:hypothetical protein
MSVRARLGIDSVLAVAFLVTYHPALTGLGLHEWLAVALAAVCLFHLALNWDWAVHTAKTLWARLMKMSALNFVVDVCLFSTTVMVTLSGLMVSQVVGPMLGLTPSVAPLWHTIHLLSAGAAVTTFAVHGVLHWRWIWNAVTRWLADRKGEPRETDAKEARGGGRRGRHHRSRHVGRRDDRHRAVADHGYGDGAGGAAEYRTEELGEAGRHVADHLDDDRQEQHGADLPEERLRVHVLPRGARPAAVSERGRTRQRQ